MAGAGTPQRARSRRAILTLCFVAVATVVAATLSSCGVAPGAEVSASMESAPRPEPRSELTDPDLTDPGLPGPDLSQPGLEDLLPPELLDPDGNVPGLEGASQECVELSSAYSKAVVLAFAGDPDGELPRLFEQLEAAAPIAVRDDLQVVRRIVTEASEGGLIDATGALISDEFVDANASVANWLASLCADGGA